MGQTNCKVYESAEITQEIDLSFQDMTKIPRRLISLTKLQKLIMASNKIAELPKSLGRLKNLTCLDLSGNKIKALPNEVGDLVALKHLNLSFNCLWILPPTLFASLVNLETIDLTCNKIWKLDCALFKLKKLRELRIGRNKELVMLPDLKDGSQLEKLRIFVPDENAFTEIPPVIRHMHGITDLNLSKNLIKVFSEETIIHVSKLRALRTLNLSNNKIKIALPAIRELFFLRDLDLSYNPILLFPNEVKSMMNLNFKQSHYVVQRGASGGSGVSAVGTVQVKKSRFANFFSKK